ncbi:putative Oxidoreductase [Mesorhizobium plurifarium]|uniref:Putative Oxidoreductase n=1 Tax=Mesorhizobium plurifarium TaxID=69974 RepID=A0A090D9C2_MESPL|nr:putative Oxidoreductase [Mesorhizobium plurifarium]
MMPVVRLVPKYTDSNGWWETLPQAPSPRVLSGQIRVQTAIIGGGICGVATANRLAELRPSDEFCLIEAERIGNGASGRNAGFMLNLHSHGTPKKLDILRRNIKLWEAGLASLRRKVEEWQIPCDWSNDGRFYGAAGPDGEKHIDEIAETLDQLGHDYTWFDQKAMRERIGTGFYSRGLHAPGNALVNPAALMRGLARNLPRNIDVYENTPVLGFERESGAFRIRTAHGTVLAERIVLAAGAFLRQFGIGVGKFVPMGTYASLTAPLNERALAHLGTGQEFGLLGASAYGATIRLTRDKRLFVRNLFNFVPGAPLGAARVAEIAKLHRKAMAARWPALAEEPFEHSWGGVMAFTLGNGTIFGEYQPGLFAILTHDISPMTRGEAAGGLLAEYMEKLDSDLLSVQLSIPAPQRLPPRPFLDVGVALKSAYLHYVAGREF